MYTVSTWHVATTVSLYFTGYHVVAQHKPAADAARHGSHTPGRVFKDIRSGAHYRRATTSPTSPRAQTSPTDSRLMNGARLRSQIVCTARQMRSPCSRPHCAVALRPKAYFVVAQHAVPEGFSPARRRSNDEAHHSCRIPCEESTQFRALSCCQHAGDSSLTA